VLDTSLKMLVFTNIMAVADHDILKPALRLFAEKGFGAVTTKMIAEAAGITEMTLFRKFQTKRNILDRAVSDLSRDDPDLDSLFDQFVGDPALDIPRLGYHIWHQLSRWQEIIRIMLNSPEIDSPELRAFGDHKLRIFKETISQYIQRYKNLFRPDLDAAAAVVVLSSLLMGVSILTEVTGVMPELTDEAIQAKGIELLLRGMI
jgi:AcrR family transcriptional regulator